MSKSDIKTRFGTVVKSRRLGMGISQEELAGRAGLHRTYVCDVERGTRNVSLESIEKLALALEVPISRLLSSTDKSSSGSGAQEFLSSDDLVDILFVEDRALDVELAMEALKTAKITNRIHVVRDGEAALHFLFCTGEYVHRRPGKPQLILLDLGLPKIGGLEVLRRIKADPQTRDIPVVVLTASNRDRDILTSQRLGAEDYIVKPVDFQNLSEVTPKLSFQWALLKRIPKLEGEPA
jgi:CheY-like chemotaxis protein/DNA-binding XRE family transcriptional regulator